MSNKNLLYNVACPACGNDKEFWIQARAWLSVRDDASTPITKCMRQRFLEHEIDERDTVVCPECGREGCLEDFTTEDVKIRLVRNH